MFFYNMNALFAKTDSSGNMTLTSQNKLLSSSILETYAKYIKKYGSAKVVVAVSPLMTFIKHYVSAVFDFVFATDLPGQKFRQLFDEALSVVGFSFSSLLMT